MYVLWNKSVFAEIAPECVWRPDSVATR